MTTDQIVRGIIDYLKDKGRLADLPEIAEQLSRQSLNQIDPDLATVVTAVPLRLTQKRALRLSLNRSLKRRFKLKARVDPTIMAGIKVIVGGRVIDLSVNQQLQQLADNLTYD